MRCATGCERPQNDSVKESIGKSKRSIQFKYVFIFQRKESHGAVSNFDEKQKRLISVWYARAEDMPDDYGKFISLWISLNAYCCAKYSEAASKLQADLQNHSGLEKLKVPQIETNATLTSKNSRYTLKIENPDLILIQISERYTEDLVFQEFSKDFANRYRELCSQQSKLQSLVSQLRSGLTRKGRCYVVNMAKAASYDEHGDFHQMIEKRIVVPFDNATSLRELKNFLYQIRCNIFHGEKQPGEVNDDRVVKLATPVLRELLLVVLSAEGLCACGA